MIGKAQAMVSDELPPSRAASLALVGGELALNFANTSSGRGSTGHQEHLRATGDVVDWAEHARAILPQDADWLRSMTPQDPQLAQKLLMAALALRESIYNLGAELAAGRPAPREEVDRIAAVQASSLAKAALQPIAGRYAWSWDAKTSPIEAVLGPISLSAMKMLMQADLTRIKQCPGEKCGWLFLDATKNKSRRWCEMEVCGNRAKQKRRAERMRKT